MVRYLFACGLLAWLIGPVVGAPLPKGAVGRLGPKATPDNKADHGDYRVITFSADDKRIATGVGWGVRLWDVATRKRLATLRQPDSSVGVFFTPDGKTLMGVTRDGADIWDVATGKKLRHLGKPAGAYRVAFALSPDGKVFIADVKGDLHFFDFTTGKELTDRRALGMSETLGMVFSPDGRRLASHIFKRYYGARTRLPGDERDVLLWDAAAGRLLLRFPHSAGDSSVRASCFSPDGRYLACVAHQPRKYKPEEDDIKPDDGRPDTFLRLLEVASAKEVVSIDPRPATIGPVAYSPNGRLLAAACWPVGKSSYLQIWDARTGKELRRIPYDETCFDLAFSPDSKLLASAHPYEALLWDMSDLPPKPKGPAVPARKDLDRLWADLAAAAAPRARAAVHALADAPEQSVPLLRDRLKPAPGKGAKQVAALIAGLDDADYATREAASAELAKLGDAAGDALRKALAKPPSAEARRRLEKLVNGLGWPVRDPGRLRTLRALEVLEHAGTPDAVKVVRALAGGAAGALETEEAKATLARLLKRPAAKGKP